MVDNRKKRILQGQKAEFVGRGAVKVATVRGAGGRGAGRWSVVH